MYDSLLKKIFFFVICCSMLQANATKTDSTKIQFKTNTIAVGSGYYNLLNHSPKNSSYEFDVTQKSYLPIYIKYEKQMGKHFSIGFNGAYQLIAYQFKHSSSVFKIGEPPISNTYTNIDRLTIISLLARCNYILPLSNKFSLYAGYGLGLNVKHTKLKTTDASITAYELIKSDFKRSNIFPFGVNATIGAKYFFYKNWGGYVEMGIEKTWLQMGVFKTF